MKGCDGVSRNRMKFRSLWRIRWPKEGPNPKISNVAALTFFAVTKNFLLTYSHFFSLEA